MESDRTGGEIHALVEISLQIEDAVIREGRHAIAGLRVERDQPIALRHVEDAFFFSVGPVREPAPRKLSRRCRSARALVFTVHPLQLTRRGIEAREELRANPATSDIPVIAVTASVMPEDRQRVIDAGFDGYQRKPINLKEFVAAVREVLAARAAAGGSP